MKKNNLICLCILFSQTIYSQINSSQQEEKQRFQNMLSTSTKTMVINTLNIPQNTILEFKNELSSWKEKVVSSQIDSINHTFTIIHYKLLHPIEMETFLNKYKIKKETIVGYN
jgi:hypothetical protein